jgi:hypothetical protein
MRTALSPKRRVRKRRTASTTAPLKARAGSALGAGTGGAGRGRTRSRIWLSSTSAVIASDIDSSSASEAWRKRFSRARMSMVNSKPARLSSSRSMRMQN